MRSLVMLLFSILFIATPGCARSPQVAPAPQPCSVTAPPPIVEPELWEEGP